MQTYTDVDGQFQFEYPAWFTRCVYENGSWGTCASYKRLCGPAWLAAWSPDSHTFLCAAYPPDRIPPGTYFLGAAVSISRINAAPSKSECEDFAPHAAYARQKKTTEVINGTRFVSIALDGAAMGHSSDFHAYRAFHGGACYELDLAVNYLTGTGYDPGTLKEFDTKPVEEALSETLHSFRFLK